jgi:hypothetical protein
VKLDDTRIGVRSGDGIVARVPDAVLVVPFAGGVDVDQAGVDRLLEACRRGPVAGRLDELRAAGAGVPSYAIVAEVDGTLGVLAVGDASVAIAGGEPVLRLAGRDPDGWSVRVADGFGSLDVGLEGDAPDPRLDLQAGVVAGVGVVLWPTGVAMAAPAPAAMPVMAPKARAASAPAPAKAPAKVARGRKRAQPAPEPVMAPIAPAPAPEPVMAPIAPAPAAPAETTVVEVWGIRCKKGHFNDPAARYCGICGIHMVQDKVARVKGPRPVLGFLVLDDGMSFKLDTDYVLGSDPHDHDAVRSGMARPLVVKAESDVISPVHARIVLRDWDVLVSDCGSLYGTYVWSPGGTDWERLSPEQEIKLGAGSQFMVAQRGFMFQPVNKR